MCCDGVCTRPMIAHLPSLTASSDTLTTHTPLLPAYRRPPKCGSPPSQLAHLTDSQTPHDSHTDDESSYCRHSNGVTLTCRRAGDMSSHSSPHSCAHPSRNDSAARSQVFRLTHAVCSPTAHWPMGQLMTRSVDTTHTAANASTNHGCDVLISRLTTMCCDGVCTRPMIAHIHAPCTSPNGLWTDQQPTHATSTRSTD